MVPESGFTHHRLSRLFLTIPKKVVISVYYAVLAGYPFMVYWVIGRHIASPSIDGFSGLLGVILPPHPFMVLVGYWAEYCLPRS
jgi:hypothetical protein